jgi:hypothetical protein
MTLDQLRAEPGAATVAGGRRTGLGYRHRPRSRTSSGTGVNGDQEWDCLDNGGSGDLAASVRLAEGCEGLVPREQRCCGALESHSGREPSALAKARRTTAVFERLHEDHTGDHVVTNVAACGSSMKE